MIKHYHHHFHLSYVTSIKRHFLSTLFIVGASLILTVIIFGWIIPPNHANNQISLAGLLTATLFTVIRLAVAYCFALLFSVPLALLVTSSPKVERILLPLFDIIQSIPVLAFFPVIILLFIKYDFLEGAAIFIIFLDMIWNITFNMIGGLKTIPEDINLVSKAFKASGIKRLFYVTLPSILPYIITGSLLAWGQGWNIVIVAEVLRNYVPNNPDSRDLYGLGSLLVNGISSGDTVLFASSLITLIIVIAIFNFFIWQRLLHKTERYRFV